MAKYGTFIYGDGTLYGDGEAIFPIPGLTRVPWIFRDLAGNDEYEFAINPLDANVPSAKKTVTTDYTTAGNAINWEGRQSPQILSFSGTILTREHYEIMVRWIDKSTQINLSDDLDRKYWILLTSFSPRRVYVPAYPWRHEYNAEATILSWN